MVPLEKSLRIDGAGHMSRKGRESSTHGAKPKKSGEKRKIFYWGKFCERKDQSRG